MDKAELRRIEEHGADFFVTGNEYVRDALDLKFIPREHPDARCGGRVVLADDKQDLSQSLAIAKEVFGYVKPRTIKFVLIGLSPYIIPTSDEEPLTAWDVQTDAPILEEYIKLCVDNGAKPAVVILPIHASCKKNYNAEVVKTFRDTINSVVRKYKAAFINLSDVIPQTGGFQSKYRFSPEGATAVSALLGERLYFANVISLKNILDADNEYFNVLKKYFPRDYLKLNQHTFCRLACADYKRLSKTLSKDDLLDLMARVFSDMTYNHLANLSAMLPKDTYNNLADRIFKISAENISCKNKIKVGFALRNASEWCGDELYNLFAANDRFELTVFVTNSERDEIEKLRAHNLNVVMTGDKDTQIPGQDVFIFLSLYDLPVMLNPENLTVKTLMIQIPYGFRVISRTKAFYNQSIFRIPWKIFFELLTVFKDYNENCSVGMPRGLYSGYPRMDIFFKKDMSFSFNWKMARPDAKKIIWAPHWSINTNTKRATFHWNYQFMYEFAKAHPEISWVVKPHPLLINRAIQEKVFLSHEAFEEYRQRWNDLPNAQFYTGAYYQDIFATSDGMIHDSGSFIAEYQYVDKPMIYLLSGMQNFTDPINEILNASYTVDGKDFDAIAAMIQRVFIESNDYKAAERKKIFDKYFNYPKYNGMSASKFIYKTISQDLGV